ncbi:MAG: GEVED domain-containing protein [Bacteroidales bacterium]
MVSHHVSVVSLNTETSAVADDFDVPSGETWEIGSISLLGTYWSGQPGGGDTLNVYILNDNNGIPGDTVYGYFAYTNFLKQEENINGYVNTYFEILLPAGVTLTGGTYWVSVQMYSDKEVTGQWGWFDHLPTPVLNGADWHWINPKDGFGLGFTTWTPATTVVGPWLQHDVSFAIYGPSVDNDLSLLEITSPDDYYYGPPAGPQDVTIEIKNEGTNPQSGFDISYVLNGNEVTENIGTVVLYPNESHAYTFAQQVDISVPGNYSLSASVSLTGDENPENDSKNMNIFVYDPTVYTMPSMSTTSITTCSGTFADNLGVDGDLVVDDWGTITFYPSTPGAKIKLQFLQFDIGWSDFWIYDGEDENATELGYWEDTISPGTLTAGYLNTSGALTIKFIAQGWTPFESPGWAANISCHTLPADDFAIIDIEVSHPVITEYDHVTVYAHIKNVGTNVLNKDITFSANGIDFAVVPTGLVNQSDTVIVEATWVPEVMGDYEVRATLPEDQGTDNNNTMATMQHVLSYVYFSEGFELMKFPPDGWRQTNEFWYRDDYAPAVGEGHARLDGSGAIFDTLITPKLNISAGDKIRFSAFSSNWWPGEMNLVWIDAVTGEGHLIQDLNLPPGWYSTFEIDVSAAVGNNYLGFAGTGMLGGGYGRLHLDVVEGIGLEKFFYNDDLKAYQLNGNNVPTVNTPTSFNIEIGNLGLNVQSGNDYTVKLMSEPGIELMSYPGVDLDPKETIEMTLDYTFSTSGQKHVYAVVDFADDEDNNNNTSVPLVIFVQQTGTIQIPIGEGGTLQPWHPVYPGGGDEGGTFSQTLFLSENIGSPMTITGIMYYYWMEQNFPVYDFPLQLWFYETDASDVADTAFIPVTNMYLTFDGTLDLYPGHNGVYIPLDFPYPYTGQNLMVTAFKANPSPYLGTWSWKTTQSDDVMVRYINDLNDPIDPYDSLNLNSFYPHMETEFANVRFFKIDLTGQYCIPQTINGTINGDFVDGITFNELANLGTGGQGGLAYHNYTSYTTPVERDRYYELTVQAQTSGANGSIAAWIDFNGDKDFDDEGERVLHMNNAGPSQEVSALIKIPADAELGITLLRVRNSADPVLFTSCGAVDYGETEDYTVNILATEQIYNPVTEYTMAMNEDGNVDLNWSMPENPGESLIEGYEMSTWPPLGWDIKTSLTLDGTLTDPTDDTWMQYSDSLFYVYNGAFSAFCADTAPNFNWLITPQVQIYSNDDLSFMLNYSSDASGYSKFYVMAELEGVWTILYDLTEEIVFYNNYEEVVNVELTQFAGKTIRVAFVTENNDAYPIAIDDIILKGIENDGKSVDGILGYNIYRNGELLFEITDPSVFSSTDLVDETENYIYCIAVAYEGGESESLCEESFFLLPLTPPINVRATADNNDVTVKWLAPNQGMMRFRDDFENYSLNQQVACQNPDDWSTWTLEPCSANDPFISDEKAYSGTQSVIHEIESDLLYKNDMILTAGKYSINFKMYIPELYNAYFNVLQEHDLGTGSHWGFQAFFDQGGEGTIDAGAYSAAIFAFEYDEWMYVEVLVDMDTDWAQFLINDELIYEWQWSLGITGGNNLNTLQAVDFYAWSSNAPAKFFTDDFQLIQLYDNINDLSYNVYRNEALISTTTVTEFYDDDIESGIYTYCISALYDTDESETSCDFISIISNPENFTAAVQNEKRSIL